VLFKICGIKEIKTIKCCEANNVNFFGMIFFNKSPRFINMSQAMKLTEYAKTKKIKPVGVFVNEDINNIKNYIKNLNLKIIQLHGNENDEYLREIKKFTKIKIIKSISINNISDLKKMDNYEVNDYFLLDYMPNNDELPGGNAKKFDWSIVSHLNINKPWFLSGGIKLSNINKIKKYTKPDGIDLSSGVEEAPGIKNLKMINNLFIKYYGK